MLAASSKLLIWPQLTEFGPQGEREKVGLSFCGFYEVKAESGLSAIHRIVFGKSII